MVKFSSRPTESKGAFFMNTTYSAQLSQLAREIDTQLKNQSVSTEFPDEVLRLSEQDLRPEPCPHRQDLRSLCTFTIDGADCQDMDDAISLDETEDGYLLGVHIADVSAYVRPGTLLDDTALARGSSIYLVGRTIPMLPDLLNRNLCSLMEGRDRLTLSVLVKLDREARVLDYLVRKAAIRSRKKCTYQETDRILDHSASPALQLAYAPIRDRLFALDRITDLLRSRRAAAGAVIEPDDHPIVSIRNGRLSVEPRTPSVSAKIVEECMILANHLVGIFACQNRLPALFRTQDTREDLAEYQSQNSLHASLALDKYCHFTAPIRRYGDLLLHRRISAFLDGTSPELLRYTALLHDPEGLSDLMTRRARRASAMETQIHNFCYMLHFADNGQHYTGRVVRTMFRQNMRLFVRLDGYNVLVAAPPGLQSHLGERVALQITANSKRILTASHVSLLEAPIPCPESDPQSA